MSFKQKKRGRPCQNLPTLDKGTEELQRKREALLKEAQVQQAELTESLLGLLYAHQVITKPLYEAGQFFGELGYRYEVCLGQSFRPTASALVLNRRGKPTLDDSLDERQTKAWKKAVRALKQEGVHPYRTVLKVVFYYQDLYSIALPSFSLQEVKFLQQGLSCLEEHFKKLQINVLRCAKHASRVGEKSSKIHHVSIAFNRAPRSFPGLTPRLSRSFPVTGNRGMVQGSN